MSQETLIINDVTKLNPIPVWGVAKPTSVEEVQSALARTDVPISVGGGHFSMGGQTASPGSLHLDMRSMNKVILFSPLERTIRVQTGIRWCDIQKFIDPHGLAVKIMQTYANFTSYLVAAVLFVLLTIPLARFTDHLILVRERRERATAV